MSPALLCLSLIAVAAAVTEPLLPPINPNNGWACQRVSLAYLARIDEDGVTDSPRLSPIRVLRGDPAKVPERVKVGLKAYDWSKSEERLLVGLDSGGRLVCYGTEGGVDFYDDLAYPTGGRSPERLDGPVRYLEHVWRLLDQPRVPVRDVLALLESDDLAARSAAHTILALVPSPSAKEPFWHDVGPVLVRRLPREPGDLSAMAKRRFAWTLGTAVYATRGFASRPELRRPAAKILADFAAEMAESGTCEALAQLGYPGGCERGPKGGLRTSRAVLERLRVELGSDPPK